jgi:hypothetical protein
MTVCLAQSWLRSKSSSIALFVFNTEIAE